MVNDTTAEAADSIQAVVQRAATRLRGSSPSPRLDAELLLVHVLAVPRTHLHAWPEQTLAADQALRYLGLIEERRRGRPVAYLLGHQAFHGLKLAVTADTLIPRPETELLVDFALQAVSGIRAPGIADLGTGCGAVAAAIAAARPDARVDAVEQSPAAADVARSNVRAAGAERQVTVLTGSWYEPLGHRRYHVLVANPPYVAEAETSLTSPETRFEPREALFAGDEGLAALRAIIAGAGAHLRSDGWLAVEHGYAQGRPVRTLFAKAGFQAIETRRDLTGHERMSVGRRHTATEDGRSPDSHE